jgi:hypothetical protein
MNQKEILHEIKALAEIWNEIIGRLHDGRFSVARTQATTMRRYLERLYNDCLELYKGDKHKTEWIKHNRNRMIKPLWWAEHYSLSAGRNTNPEVIIKMVSQGIKGCDEAIKVLEELDEIISSH